MSDFIRRWSNQVWADSNELPIGGRNTEKLLPDGATKATYTYEPRSGRLSSMTQPNDQGSGNPTVTYSYELDGRLKSEN